MNELRYSYPYRNFTIFIRPTEFARFGHPEFRPDRATPLTWGYRIDQIPGTSRIAWADDFATQQAAHDAAEYFVDTELYQP